MRKCRNDERQKQLEVWGGICRVFCLKRSRRFDDVCDVASEKRNRQAFLSVAPRLCWYSTGSAGTGPSGAGAYQQIPPGKTKT